MYQKLIKLLERFFKKSTLFRVGFNISPMYRRSTGRLTFVSDDLKQVDIRVKLNYKNVNYAGTMFGGSMFSCTDPIAMIQLIFILGEEYVVWDKSAQIFFKRPATETVYTSFIFTEEDIQEIKQRVAENKEIDWNMTVELTDKDKSKTFAVVEKVIYVAEKSYYKEKRKKRQLASSE